MPQIDFSIMLVTSTFVFLSFSFLYLVISCIFLPVLMYKYKTINQYIFRVKLYLYNKKIFKFYIIFWFKSLSLVWIYEESLCFNNLRFFSKFEFKSLNNQLKILHNFMINFIKTKLIHQKTLT
uniref:ATP synthase F0 subunit 8 n=1 Tax=Porphyridium aerugineum TaxID=2792 RepID=UPI001FCDD517|nr:ATP synthase F0 subunit 8 [Porphyridium aerugineum]UNJ18819.1 ATP synthase F0 subunit 8 [Porphyridium aerugineum]